MTKNFATLGILCLGMLLSAQETSTKKEHSLTIKSQFIQIKDEFNYGLVHRGLNLAGEYTYTRLSEKNKFSYQAELGFGANYNQGLGMIWSLKPLDLFYGFRINADPKLPITLGPYLAGYYKWQLYPELQSGHMFWMSSYEIGPRMELSLPVKNRLLHMSLATSLASLNSRPVYVTESYYYSLTFSDFVRNPHTNISFGSLNTFTHTDLRLELAHPEKSFSIAYEFEFMGYLKAPEFKYIVHSINLIWKLGTKKAS